MITLSKKVAIIAGEYHKETVKKMINEADSILAEHNLSLFDICWVPGSMEKPLALDKADSQALIQSYKDTPMKRVLSAMNNQLTDPHYKKLKDLIDNDQLGEIRRVHWSVTCLLYTSPSPRDS